MNKQQHFCVTLSSDLYAPGSSELQTR